MESSFGSAAQFLGQLHERGFTFLVIDRRNRLLQALSYIHAERTQYHFRSGERARYEKFVIDPVEVVASMHIIDGNAKWAREILGDIPRLELCYEDDLMTPEAQVESVRRVLAAVGLEAHEPRTSLVSVAPRSVRERVLNYEDLAATLAPTRFAGFLEN